MPGRGGTLASTGSFPRSSARNAQVARVLPGRGLFPPMGADRLDRRARLIAREDARAEPGRHHPR
jgi:hypothetical protein